MIGSDSYYGRAEVSNSDLVEMSNYFAPPSFVLDLKDIFRFGNLVDAMITEPKRCDHIRLMVDGEQFTPDEWATAYEMVKNFRKDDFCNSILRVCGGQAVKKKIDFNINFDGLGFTLPARCKYDLWSEAINYGGDIKSTAATTQRQFEDAFYHFNYDQSRAFYMDILVTHIAYLKKEPRVISSCSEFRKELLDEVNGILKIENARTLRALGNILKKLEDEFEKLK